MNKMHIFLGKKVKMVYEKICPVRGKYTVMDRNELLRGFLTQRKKNLNICKNCKKKQLLQL